MRGERSEVRGARSEVRGPRYEVRGPRSEVRGTRSEVRGTRVEVRGPRSEVRGTRSEVRGARLYGADASIAKFDLKIQHMRISDAYCVKLLNMIYGSYSGDWLLFSGSAGQYRRRWDFLLSSFGVDSSLRLTPGGLRGGSAVWAYRNGLGIQQILWNLRLRHQATLESYLQETASLTVFSSLSASSRLSFRRAAMIFDLLCHSANRQGDAAAS